MIAIHTKFMRATNCAGARIKAYTAGSGGIKGFSVTIAYPHELSFHAPHFEAVKALVAKHKLEWNLDGMRYGDSSDGKGYVFCFDQSKVE